MATTVIIPARNEEETIGAIVRTFNENWETRGNVYVGIDADTTDNTAEEVRANNGIAIHTDARGKGQVINAVLLFPLRKTKRIILCDGDYTGLTTDHINQIRMYYSGMTIGVPDWPDINVPTHVINAWPQISGFRELPWSLLDRPLQARPLHGYLTETQLNLAAIQWRMAIHHIFMEGLKSPFQWPLSDQRQTELERDRQWGIENGVFF